ncbi:unnamed protein product [Bursaphelenchus okinawaensis]|uniref:Guanine nucleotide-binding protein subunit gamma n=1 Tax=Bursaphelenchus okinawaensis TaxID=465554 RepID=A0A811KJQ8_9BILA|nr:unnamed protein product [Bursaphelenchus okinawaensis]CAG9105132.1 unnamed protein product [Bursaphelenchus okinawaensis]
MINSSEAKSALEQLRHETQNKRIKVSAAANDLVKYVQDNEKEDYLMNGFPSDKMNPYRPKNSFQCQVL